MPNQNVFRRLMAVLTEHGQQGNRHELCQWASGGRTKSSKELTDQEALAVINRLEERTMNMRRKLISMCYDVLWVTADGRADVARLDQWCRQYGRHKKGLNECTAAELQVLITQFGILRSKLLSSL